MFTGIISDIGEVVAIAPQGQELRRVHIACNYDRASIGVGASIACSGTCLTVTALTSERGQTVFAVDVGAETLAATTARSWRLGTRLNLERSLRIGDEFGGHLVTGHVDGLVELVAREDLGDLVRLTLAIPPRLAALIAPKGSVALDGTSLTINVVDAQTFSVLLIPYTLQATDLGDRRVGDFLNLEVDLIARYVARQLGALNAVGDRRCR